jgi:hypothetical protein
MAKSNAKAAPSLNLAQGNALNAPAPMTETKVIPNDLRYEVRDGRLILSIPFDKDGVPSSTGKTTIHASTRGNQPISVDGHVVHVGVNVYSK